MKRATVWWRDAHFGAGPRACKEVENDHRPAICAVTGWVVYTNAKGVSLAFERQDDERNQGLGLDDLRTVKFVPRAMIDRIEWLEPKGDG